MEILQQRVKRGKNSTLSILFVNDVQRGFVLEDKDRDLHATMTLKAIKATKVHSQTAIPTGRYGIRMRYSFKFKKVVPHLQNVPGFDCIYVHSGNFIQDTLGCLLPGLSWGYQAGEYCVRQSRDLTSPLVNEIQAAINRGEEVWYTVEQAYESATGRLLV